MFKKFLGILLVFVCILSILNGVFADEDVNYELTVTFSNGIEVKESPRDSPAEVVHFDVEAEATKVTDAVLTYNNNEVVWEQHGREHADLGDDCIKGYWHFVYTPAGILTLSSSECSEKDNDNNNDLNDDNNDNNNDNDNDNDVDDNDNDNDVNDNDNDNDNDLKDDNGKEDPVNGDEEETLIPMEVVGTPLGAMALGILALIGGALTPIIRKRR